LLTAACPPSFALENGPTISQYSHVAWGPNEGAPSRILAIAQTNDGYLWIGSAQGLFRFDGLTFQRYQIQSDPHLPSGPVVSLLALPSGDLWIGFDSGEISLLRDGRAVNYGRRNGTPNDYINCLAQDPTGAIWAGSEVGLVRLENHRWRAIGREWNFPGTAARGLYVDRSGTLWVATENTLVFLPEGGRRFQPTGIHVGQVSEIAEAPNGKLWMAETTRAVRPVPLHTRLAPSDNTGIHVGSGAFLFAREGDLWITSLGDGLRHAPDPATLHGQIGRLDSSIEVYTTKDGLSSNYDLSIFQDRDWNIWVGTDRGLDRFRRTSLAHAGGLSLNPQLRSPSIQSIVVDGQTYLRWGNLKLRPGVRNIQINYSVLNLTNPWQAHFRYRLNGVDRRWQDVGTRRTAYYMNIDPGKYRFQVIAGDLAGAWSPHAADLEFTILPFWYQTAWFRILSGSVLLLLFWMLYRIRLGQLERQFSVALEARVDERTRIARELHDTLLQSFNALLLRFQSASNLLPGRPDEARERIDSAIEQASAAITEGRDAVQELRSGASAATDLAEAIGSFARELLSQISVQNAPKFYAQVEGTPRSLNPIVRDELYRIAAEALRNSVRHAHAERIEVEIRYDAEQLRVRVRDNGSGIDPVALKQGHTPGHWGVRGMRERASLTGGNLEIWSEPGSGTEVELTIPGASAYAKIPNSRWSAFSRIWRSSS
jgi:signal transduction histidine kinase